MKLKRIVVTGTIAALLVGLAGTGSALVLMREKVWALEQERAQLAQKMKEKAAQARTRSVPKKKKQAAKAPSRVKDVKPIANDAKPGYEYVVKEGDDVVSIAIKFGISPSVLMDFNGWKISDDLKPGMVAKIPSNANPVPEARIAANSTRSPATNSVPVELRVARTDYDGETTLRLYLTQRPDMDVIRHYISVSPLQEGGLTFKYDAEYDGRKECWEPVVVVQGEFAHRTYVKLRVKKGLPPYGKGLNPHPEGALREDYVYTFTRKDRDPYVNFADDGRYLPPGGKRLLKLESVNVGKIRASVRRVEPRNVV